LSRLLAVVAVCGGLAASASAGTTQPPELADIVARVQSSVVRIVVVHPPGKPAEGDSKIARAAASETVSNIGSGFVIDASGLVATNRHVVEDSISIFVATADGSRYRADLVGAAGKADIALLRIDPSAHLPALTFGDSDSLRAGDTVIAIGSPFGFDNTVTAGIVSSVNRDIMESPFDDYIQTDAAINHGNSGGPLLNVAGQVVGMNSVLFAPGAGSVGVGFAIPSNDLRFVLDRLAMYGEVRAGMLPVRTQQVTGLMADAIGIPSAGGALIAALEPEADRRMNGQIRIGDVITRLNNEPIRDPRDLARKVAWIKAGDTAVVELYREGKRMSAEVPILPVESITRLKVIGNRPTSLGLSFAAISGGRPEDGVMLVDVDPSGSAADSGLRKGDIIMRVQQQAVSTPDQASKMLQSRIAAKHAYAALLVKRDNKQTWMPVGLPD
jgi:serine protease Do